MCTTHHGLVSYIYVLVAYVNTFIWIVHVTSASLSCFNLTNQLIFVLFLMWLLCSSQIFTCMWCWMSVNYGPCYHTYISACVYSALTVWLHCLYVWDFVSITVVLPTRLLTGRQSCLTVNTSSACLKKQQGGLGPSVTPGPPVNKLFTYFCFVVTWKYRVDICLVGFPYFTIFSPVSHWHLPEQWGFLI